MKSFPVASLALVACLCSELSAQQPTTVGIDRDLGPVRLSVGGEPGFDYTLQGATNPAANGDWDFLATFTLSGESQNWLDAASALGPKRFYRTIKFPAAPPEEAPDFRLIDQLGKSRQLRYYDGMTSVRAMVLIFTGNGCAKLQEMAPVIKTLTNRYGSPGVLFWLIDSNAGDNRSNILVTATSLGMSNGPPILHDSAQLVAHSYHATTPPEAIAINTADWTIFYRGAIDDRLGSNAVATTQHYLADALETFLGGGAYSPKATRPAGCAITFSPLSANLSYSTDIAPLLQSKCVRCHSPGNIAPWSMTNYEVVRLYKGAIRETVLTGKMPPWHADPYYQAFTNNFSLKPDEASKLIQWIDAGAPRGTGADPLVESPPPPTNYPYVWPTALGQPTNILTIPAQTISGTGDEPYHYVNVTTTFATDVWLRAAVIRPDNLSIVHHVLVYSGTNSQLQGMDGFFAGYVPGYEPATFPEGTGKFLPRGAPLTFQIHYIRNGRSNTDRTQLGFYTMPSAPPYSLQTRSAYPLNFVLGLTNIPPNNPEVPMTATFGPFARAVYLYEMSPHMHLRGSRFMYEAVYPNNSREVLLSVPFYEFHWQTLYRLAQPKLLPAGTRIVCTGAWDNSTQNPDNPDPSATVTFGQQTDDEMFIGYFNYADVPGPP